MASFEIKLRTYHNHDITIKHAEKGLNISVFGQFDINLNKYDIGDLIKALEVFKEPQE